MRQDALEKKQEEIMRQQEELERQKAQMRREMEELERQKQMELLVCGQCFHLSCLYFDVAMCVLVRGWGFSGRRVGRKVDILLLHYDSG